MTRNSELDLQTFISQSLGQIIAGIRRAQTEIAQTQSRARINPRGATVLRNDVGGRKQPHDLHTKLPIHQVEFDVAVTVARAAGSKAGAGLFVAGIGIGGQTQGTTESASVSRIRFSIPIVWPDPQTSGNG